MMATMNVVGWPVVVASLSLVVLALGLGAIFRLGVSKDITIASARAAVQLLAVGVLFKYMLDSSGADWWAAMWVIVMTAIAIATVRKRAGFKITGLTLATAIAVISTAAISIGVTFGFGVLDYEPVTLLVIAGITIGNAVPSAVLAAKQSVASSRERIGEIEGALALGFDRRSMLRFMAPRVARSALIPQIERTKVVGLIALPGAMTGLLLGGVDPIDAVVLQLLVMYLVLGSAAVCTIAIVATIMTQTVSPEMTVADWVRPEAEGFN